MTPIFPQTLYVSGNSIKEFTTEPWDEIKRDPRGVLLMWDPPNPKRKYVLGLDSAEGITGWHRGMRTQEDTKKDNSAIEVFMVDGAWDYVWKMENGNRVPVMDPRTQQQLIRHMDVQVAELAMPCDPVEAARAANVLGRIYSGTEEDQCLLILESWPGCGMLAMQELYRIGYANLWNWEYFADGPAQETSGVGWRSTDRSQRLLWQRCRRHLMDERVIIRSKFLLGEYASAVADPVKMRAVASSGKHDDRMQAANMVLWASHGWTYDIERTDEPVTMAPVIDYQRYAPGLDDEFPTFNQWREDVVSEWD